MSIPVGLSTSSVYPGNAATTFRLAGELGYDGVEVMVWSERVTQDARALLALAARYDQPVLAIHAPTLLLTRPVFGADPWQKVDRSIDLAQAVGAPTVVLHPPFFWQTRYARSFVRGVDMREQVADVRLAVENMFTWRPRSGHSTRDFQAYSPTWDPVGQGYRSVTLDISHAATSGSDALAMARALGPTLCHLHLTDGVPGFRDDHLLPGQGDQDCAGVLAHLAAGRAPVALASSDRALMRRVRALLGERLNVRDETGWKLSTTQSAAILMAALHACARQASSDDVLAWLKLAPAASAWPARAVPELEAYLRRHAVSQWPQSLPEDAPPHLEQALQAIHAARAACQASCDLPAWLKALRNLLQAAGQWEPLAQDVAGARVLETLLLTDADALHDLPAARQRLSLPAFTAWAADALEGASFIPPAAPQPDLILLPLAQVMGRPLAALVLPGCDENHLPLAPEPPGLWTPPQRAHLRLPTQAAQQAAQQTAWQHALAVPYVDLLWRQGDERGQPLLASPLVRHLALQLGLNETADDPCSTRAIDPVPTPRPAPQGSALPVATLSASAYGDLRACPYRFFALRQLNLKEAPELDAGPDKRDFGNWLHATLHHFHERLKADPKANRPTRAAWLDEAAQAVTQEKALSESDFLPFSAQWPALRESYLDWLTEHEKQGHYYERGEEDAAAALGPVTLQGRIDRIDRIDSAPGQPPRRLLLDYKTERLERTESRVKDAEDIQLPFYAALLPDDEVQAAYLSVSERAPVQTVDQPNITALRDALVEGVSHDMRAIAAGAPLPALGEGSACTWCAARGLCRRDFWSEAPAG